MASDTSVKPEVTGDVPGGVMELLQRMDARISQLPSLERIEKQWAKQDELHERSHVNFKLEEESRALLKIHIGDMADLRKIQKESNEKTEKLSEAQSRLAESLEHINDSLKNGFDLGNSVVKLFGKITFVFLAAVVVLSLVIIWIARLDISRDDGHGGKLSIHSGREASEDSAPTPSAP